MNRILSRAIAALALLGVAAHPAAGERLAKGSSVLWLGLHGGTAEIVAPPLTIGSMFTSDEIGAHVAYSYFLSDAWALAVSGDFSSGREKFEATLGGTEEFTISTWDVRVGLDRYAFIDDEVAVYAGPGIRYWAGNGEYEGVANPAGEWPDVTQFGLNPRIGIYTRLGSSFGLFAYVGHVIGFNSADDSAGENTWWTSSHEGSVGLAVDF